MFLLNKQEVFDKIITGLRRQGKQSKDGFFCAYRSADGCKCAVGQLIPDEAYHPMMEGYGVNHPVILEALLRVVDPSTILFISYMQYIHDRDDVKLWEQSFKRAAELHNLIYV